VPYLATFFDGRKSILDGVYVANDLENYRHIRVRVEYLLQFGHYHQVDPTFDKYSCDVALLVQEVEDPRKYGVVNGEAVAEGF